MRVIASLILAFAGFAAAFSPSSVGNLALRSSNARATSPRTLRCPCISRKQQQHRKHVRPPPQTQNQDKTLRLEIDVRRRIILTVLFGRCSIVMGGADRIPPGPKGRGPFTEEDKFKLPDGRVYVPGDAATDGLYGKSSLFPIVLLMCDLF